MTRQTGVLGISEEKRKSVLAEVAFHAAVLDALPSSVAIVDSYGTIIAVNAAWRRFGEANGLRDPDFCVGANYFSICRAAVEPAAREAYVGIHDVLSGQRRSFSMTYPCHSPDEKRWFVMHAKPMTNFPGFVVLTHDDVTRYRRSDKGY